MADKRSKSPKKGKDAARDEATRVDSNEASVATTTRTTQPMSENETSIIHFSEEIATAEPPVPLPKGDYPAEIRGAVKKNSATSGNDYARVSFFISSDAYPADFTEGDPDGMTLDYNRVTLVDTPAGRHRVRKFCENIGAPLPKKELDLNEWVGRTATVTIEHNTFEGEVRAQIAKVSAA